MKWIQAIRMNEYYAIGHDPNASWIAARVHEFVNNKKAKRCVFQVNEFHAIKIRNIYGDLFDITLEELPGTYFLNVRLKKKQ